MNLWFDPAYDPAYSRVERTRRIFGVHCRPKVASLANMNTQRMTLDEYISKHGLEPLRTWPPVSNEAAPIASIFITYEESGKTKDFPHTDKFQLYANKERTRFVSKNLTKGLFRIVHNELVSIKSQWEPVNSTYEVQPIG